MIGTRYKMRILFDQHPLYTMNLFIYCVFFFLLNNHETAQTDNSALTTDNFSVVDSSVNTENAHNTELMGIEHITDDGETNSELLQVSINISCQQKDSLLFSGNLFLPFCHVFVLVRRKTSHSSHIQSSHQKTPCLFIPPVRSTTPSPLPSTLRCLWPHPVTNTDIVLPACSLFSELSSEIKVRDCLKIAGTLK